MHTPPSWPVIQPSGKSFGQAASIWYLGALCAWSGDGHSPIAIASAAPQTCRCKQRIIVVLLLEFLAAEIDRLDRAHISDVVERILCKHEEIGGLALGERAEVLVDAEELGIVLGEGLDHLHLRKPGVPHELHLPVLEEALDEEAFGLAARIGAEAESDAGIRQLPDVDFVDLEGVHELRTGGIVRLLVALLRFQEREPLRRQALLEERIVGEA